MGYKWTRWTLIMVWTLQRCCYDLVEANRSWIVYLQNFCACLWEDSKLTGVMCGIKPLKEIENGNMNMYKNVWKYEYGKIGRKRGKLLWKQRSITKDPVDLTLVTAYPLPWETSAPVCSWDQQKTIFCWVSNSQPLPGDCSFNPCRII